MTEPILLTFFHDVLCPWSYVAAARLRTLKFEYGDAIHVQLRPFPLRVEEERPDRRELASFARNARKAAKEPEGRLITPALWKSPDVPLSSLPPLYAVEAAQLQGEEARDAFLDRMRTAAHGQGINVARTDVIFELASSTGLDMAHFARSFHSRLMRKVVDEAAGDAARHGVRAVPAVTIGDDWLLTGLRSMVEYRQVLRRWREERGGGIPERQLH